MAHDRKARYMSGVEEERIKNEDREAKEEEARYMKGKEPLVSVESRSTRCTQMRTHTPLRQWRPHCVTGRRKHDPQRTPKDN